MRNATICRIATCHMKGGLLRGGVPGLLRHSDQLIELFFTYVKEGNQESNKAHLKLRLSHLSRSLHIS